MTTEKDQVACPLAHLWEVMGKEFELMSVRSFTYVVGLG